MNSIVEDAYAVDQQPAMPAETAASSVANIRDQRGYLRSLNSVRAMTMPKRPSEDLHDHRSSSLAERLTTPRPWLPAWQKFQTSHSV